jgi:hypothetical protein
VFIVSVDSGDEKPKDKAALIKTLEAARDLVLGAERMSDKALESKKLLAAAGLMRECLTSLGVPAQAAEPFSCDVFAHDWGVLVPTHGGFVWQIQTGGVLCNQVFIEGVFIPLGRPRELDEKQPVDLLDLLQDANRGYRDTTDVWARIKAAMHFDFDVVGAPDGEPESDEGLLWVKFTKFDDGRGHGAWVKQLIGRTVVLIYPNSD